MSPFLWSLRDLPGSEFKRLRAQTEGYHVTRLTGADTSPLAMAAVRQFTSRMNRAKTRLTDLDEKIAAQAADEGRLAHIHLGMSRLTERSGHLGPQLKKGETKREIIRAVVQRIEIGPTNIAIVLRPPT